MIPFSVPYIDDDVINEVVQTLRSGWISTGPKTREFENELEKYCKSRRVLCVNSAAAGLELALRWYGVKEGDEVIIPAYTYCATAHAVEHCGATPVMVDIGKDFNIDAEKIRQAITTRTKAIIPVDIGGYPADYEAIFEIVNDPVNKLMFNAETEEQELLGRILVLADAAHSLGAKYKGKQTGAVADITVFSFHAVKNITTSEGGAISLQLPLSFNIENIYNTLRVKSLHGQDKDALSKLQSGNWRYDVPFAGYKMNMPDVLAAIGLAQLRKYDSFLLPKRKEIFERYSQAFNLYEWAQVPEFSSLDKESSYHLYLFRIKNINENARDEIIKRMFSMDIAVNVHFIPLPMLSYYENKGYDIKSYPNAYKMYSAEISLPVHHALTNKQVDEVIYAVIDTVEEYVEKIY